MEDLLDRRGRLVRLGVATTIGLALTLVVMHLIARVAEQPDADAISQVLPFLLGIAMFVLLTRCVFAGIDALQKRVR